MVVCGALVASPTSNIFSPQDLAYQPVGLDYGNGTAYAGILMLEGAMARDAVTTVAAPVSPALRLEMLLRGELAATVLQEPFITVAEKSGCRLVSTTFFYGTWVAGREVTPETYAAFLRALTRAVRMVNSDKRGYLSYFIDAAKAQAQTAGTGVPELTADDFNLARIQLKEPTPIPEDQARWAWNWMAGWGLLSGEFDASTQINQGLQEAAFGLAAV